MSAVTERRFKEGLQRYKLTGLEVRQTNIGKDAVGGNRRVEVYLSANFFDNTVYGEILVHTADGEKQLYHNTGGTEVIAELGGIVNHMIDGLEEVQG